MPTTRGQAARQKEGAEPLTKTTKEPKRGKKRSVQELRKGDKAEGKEKSEEELPEKKAKVEGPSDAQKKGDEQSHKEDHTPLTGTIERGHIYFFYRPKVELEEATSIDEVSRFYMLLVPRTPEFSTAEDSSSKKQNEQEDQEMTLLNEGADAVPAKETRDNPKKHYRLIIIGKKQLPDPDVGGAGKRSRSHVFWATVGAVGDDLESVEKGLGEKSYETKTRGTRHEAPARLAGRGAYAIVNNEPRVPSQRETHLGYHLSHPSDMGEVQEALGIHTASSFVLQVKNPLAPPSGGQRGLSEDKRAKYPDWIMRDIFGKGGRKGREDYGLRFASVETPELLEHEGAELLLIASRVGDEGLEASLGEGRGQALHEAEQEEAKESIDDVLRELATDREKFPAEPLEGRWI